MVDTVIFDIGRVLVEWDWQGYLKKQNYPEEKRNKLAKAIFLSETWCEADRGIWSDEEILQSFIQAVPEYEKDVRMLWDGMEACIRKYDYTDGWIGELKQKGCSVYYLSNYGKTLREKTKEALNFTELCDGGIFSYQIQKVKPDLQIYQALIEKYGLTPEHCVFIDDVKENVEAAEKCSIHGIHFTNFEAVKAEIFRKIC